MAGQPPADAPTAAIRKFGSELCSATGSPATFAASGRVSRRGLFAADLDCAEASPPRPLRLVLSLPDLAPALDGARTMPFGRFIAAAYHAGSAVLPRVLPLFQRARGMRPAGGDHISVRSPQEARCPGRAT